MDKVGIIGFDAFGDYVEGFSRFGGYRVGAARRGGAADTAGD